MSQPVYFYDGIVSGAFTTSYTYVNFGFPSKNMIIVSAEPTNTDDIYFSFDGQVIHGRVTAGDAALNMSGKRNKGIYIKSKSGSQNARIWAY